MIGHGLGPGGSFSCCRRRDKIVIERKKLKAINPVRTKTRKERVLLAPASIASCCVNLVIIQR